LGPSWPYLGPSLANLCQLVANLCQLGFKKASWRSLGPSWGNLVQKSAPTRPQKDGLGGVGFGPLGVLLEPFGLLGPWWHHFLILDGFGRLLAQLLVTFSRLFFTFFQSATKGQSTRQCNDAAVLRLACSIIY